MRSPIEIHLPPAYNGNLKITNEWPPDCDYKIPFARVTFIQCGLGNFLSQSVNGNDYRIELRSFAVKEDGYVKLAVKKPCISIALFLKGNISGQLSGSMAFELNAKTYTIFYLPAGMQQITMTKGDYLWLCIIPPSYYLKYMALEHPGMKDIVNRLLIKEEEGAFLELYPLPPAIPRIIKRLEKTTKQGAALDFELRKYMLEILALYNEQYKRNEPGNPASEPPKEKAHAVLDYIQANLGDQNLGGLNELSLRFYTSSKTLTTAFKKLTGKTIPQYISDERMEWAKRLLDKKEMHVFEIAWIVGYSDTANFNRKFKKKFGYPPLNRKDNSDKKIK